MHSNMATGIETWFNEYDDKHYSVENKLIRFSKSQVEQLKNKEDWKDDYIVREIVEGYGAENG